VSLELGLDAMSAKTCASSPRATVSLELDIVICTHNNAPLLERTLEALAQQKTSEDTHWRVLVVDNRCTDDTAQVVERHVRVGRIPGLRRVEESQLGLTPARVRGVRETLAPWIGYVDDDCLLRPDWVEEAAQFLREHPDCGALGGQVILDWEMPPPGYFHDFAWAYAAQYQGEEDCEVGCLAGAGMIVSRRALEESGWLDKQWMSDRVGKKLVSGGDVEMALRIRSAGSPLWYHPACQLQHVIPARRISSAYLNTMNAGLGVSQTFAEAMTWPRGFASWRLNAFGQAARGVLQLLLPAAKALAGRRSKRAVLASLCFARGRWAGFFAMLRFQGRRQLLGCAKTKSTT
jgi:GT2 family glycosyltransferase